MIPQEKEPWFEDRQEAPPEQVAFIKYLLAYRFGRTPHWVEQRLQAASHNQLQRWATRMVRDQSLDQIFY